MKPYGLFQPTSGQTTDLFSQGAFEASFHLIMWRISASHEEHGMATCSSNLVSDVNHLERITGLVFDLHHLPSEKRLQLLDLHSLQLRQLRADLVITFKTFTGLLEVDPNLLFLPSTHPDTPE